MSVQITRSYKRAKWVAMLLIGAVASLVYTVITDHSRAGAMSVDTYLNTVHADGDDDSGGDDSTGSDDGDDGC